MEWTTRREKHLSSNITIMISLAFPDSWTDHEKLQATRKRVEDLEGSKQSFDITECNEDQEVVVEGGENNDAKK